MKIHIIKTSDDNYSEYVTMNTLEDLQKMCAENDELVVSCMDPDIDAPDTDLRVEIYDTYRE